MNLQEEIKNSTNNYKNKKMSKLMLIICLTLFISSCTLIQYFTIVNSSNEEIEVRYEIKDNSNFLPEVTSESNLNTVRFLQKDWEKMPTNQYSYNKDKKIFTIIIKPHQVVKIGWGDPYYFEKNDENYFNFKNLKIVGKNKEVYFENGSKLLDEFKKNDYRIFYK